MRLSALLVSIFLPLLLAACIPAAKPLSDGVVPIAERPPPAWMRATPDDPDSYHGVSYVPQGMDPTVDARLAADKAREALLADVQAGFRRGLAGQPAEAIVPRIAWDFLAQELSILTPKDTFPEPHKKRVWAYVTLKRDDLAQMLERRRSQLEPRARKHVLAAQEALNNKAWADALREQLSALHRVSGPEGVLMRGTTLPLLRDEIEAELNRMLLEIRVSKVSGPEAGDLTSLRLNPLMVQVLRTGGEPLARLPVAFRFSKGEGSVTPTAQTDPTGRASASLFSVDPRISPAEVLATVDVQGLLGMAKLTPLPDAALLNLTLDGARFSVTLNPPRMLLSHIERGGTGGNRSRQVVDELSEVFRKQGLTVRDASVNMLVNPEVFRLVEAGKDPGDVKDIDYIGVLVIALDKVTATKGKYQTVLTGAGVASFRLYDLSSKSTPIDVTMLQSVTGFSQGDIERNFFLQALDELRSRVLDELAETPLLMRTQ